MRGFLPFFLLISVLGLSATPGSRFDGVFGPGEVGTRPLTSPQIHALLALAAESGWNLFDLLDEAGLYLKHRGLRVTVDGAALRAETRFFDLGDNRVDTLLPLVALKEFSVGDRSGSDADIEVLLERPVAGFLELGEFSLQTRYGFRTIGDRVLEGAFGVTVKNGWFTWTLQKIARVPDPTGGGSPNFIAIYLDNFFRPKRWLIDPVKTLSAPGPKP